VSFVVQKARLPRRLPGAAQHSRTRARASIIRRHKIAQVRQLRHYLGQRHYSLVSELASLAIQRYLTRREHGEQLGQETHGLPAPVRTPKSCIIIQNYSNNIDGDMEAVVDAGEDLGTDVGGLDTPLLELHVRDSSQRRSV
jgi:hypothetical protein